MKSKLKIVLTSLFLILTILFAGCSGSASPDKKGGEEIVPTGTADVNFKDIVSVNDLAVFTWDESKNTALDYYVIELFDTSTNKSVKKTDKIAKNGGPYKQVIKGLTSEKSYKTFIYAYDKDNKKLFEESITIYLSLGELTNYKVSLNDKGKVLHEWNRANILCKDTIKIKILMSESKDGTYTVKETVTGTYTSRFEMDSLEMDKTFWFQLQAWYEDDYLLYSTEPVDFIIEKTVPPKVSNVKSSTNYFDVVEYTWDKSVLAESYIIKIYKESTLSTLLHEEEVTENSYTYPIDITTTGQLYAVVYAKNEKGTGPVSDLRSEYYSGASFFTIYADVTDITANTAHVALSLSKASKKLVAKNATIQYALVDSEGNVYKDYQDSNEFDITGLELGTTTYFDDKAKISYTYNGEQKTYEQESSFSVKTKGFPAPSGEWSVINTGRTSITIQFPKLKADQLCGVSEDNVVYVVTAYKEGSNYSSKYVTSTVGANSVRIPYLEAGTDYYFTVKAKKNTSGAVEGEESEKSAAFTTKAALSTPVIKTIAESSKAVPYSHITVSFDPIAEDADEDIKYGLKWDIFNRTDSYMYKWQSINAINNVTSIETEQLNGGNRYNVILYAYEATEGSDTAVYSDKVSIQLDKIDDKSIPGGLYYTGDAELVDIVNPKTWEGTTPRSTDTNYSWGLYNVVGANNVVKFGLTQDMLNSTASSFKFYYVERQYGSSTSKIGTTKLAYRATIYFVTPDNDNAVQLAQFNFSTSNMPTYGSNGQLTYATLDKPSSMGVSITTYMPYMFNNSLYFLINIPATYSGYSNEDCAIGFSYKY